MRCSPCSEAGLSFLDTARVFTPPVTGLCGCNTPSGAGWGVSGARDREGVLRAPWEQVRAQLGMWSPGQGWTGVGAGWGERAPRARLGVELPINHAPDRTPQTCGTLGTGRAARFQEEVIEQLDPSLYQGLQALAETPIYQDELDGDGEHVTCGWIFQGYALPVLDRPENGALWTSLCPDLPTWTPYLGWHLHTTSTTTVYLRSTCTWRMYFPYATFSSDADGAACTPTRNASDTSREAYAFPGCADWEASGRFDQEHFGFVDSPDGGVHFPVYAPRMEPLYRRNAGLFGGCPDGWTVKSWQGAGWTATSIPAVAKTPDANNVYTKYRDPTVIDVYAETGWYLMVAVECQSLSSQGAESDCCTRGCGGEADTYHWDKEGFPSFSLTMPYTRVVLFASTSPDFQAGETLGAPGVPEGALVLLAPDRGAGGPSAGVLPNEWYGVPHAVVDRDAGVLVLYVSWQRASDSEDDSMYLPSRVSTLYAEGSYRKSGEISQPIWLNAYSSVSCFVLDLNTLGTVLGELAAPMDPVYAAASFAAVLDTMRTYNGEVLFTDGSTAGLYFVSLGVGGMVGYDIPKTITTIDPHWVWIGDELVVYWDQTAGTGSSATNCQLWRASAVRAATGYASMGGGDFSFALSVNGDYTVFLTPPACAQQFDLRRIFEPTEAEFTEDYGRLVSDPDVAVLDDADPQLRVSFFGGSDLEGVGAGLLVATFNIYPS